MIYIVAIIKDEHRDIREWTEYHLALGVDRIVLYDNDSSRGYETELGDLAAIEMRSWPGNADYRQRRVYEHFAAMRSDWSDDDWCLFIDPDEFVHLERHGDLKAFVADYRDYAGIVLSWQCFGADGRLARPDLPVREAYKKPVPLIRERHNFKSLARLNEISFWADVHRFVPQTRTLVTTRHEPVVGSEVAQLLEVAWLDHYITKSWEDYVERLRRGNITKGIRRVEHFFAYNEDLADHEIELAAELDKEQFPTLWSDRQLEQIEDELEFEGIADRLSQVCHPEVPDPLFAHVCVIELMNCCQFHLDRIADVQIRERSAPRFHALMRKQITFLNAVPCSIENYRGTIMNNILSTPFARLAHEE